MKIKVTYLDVMEVQKEEVISVENLNENQIINRVGQMGIFIHRNGKIQKWISPHRILEVEFL